jgi:hypothetical protein
MELNIGFDWERKVLYRKYIILNASYKSIFFKYLGFISPKYGLLLYGMVFASYLQQNCNRRHRPWNQLSLLLR